MSPGTFEQTIGVEILDMGAAQAFDVEGAAADEMAQPLDLLERTGQPAAAAPRHRALLAHHFGLQRTRAFARKLEFLRILRPQFFDEAQHLRDDVAGALDAHGVADAHVQPLDLVLVVQGGARHRHAADGDRLQHRDRRQRAGAADLDDDVFQHGLRLLGGEFMRRGPARRAADEAQAALPVGAVDLVDHAVDVVGQRWRARRRCSR